MMDLRERLSEGPLELEAAREFVVAETDVSSTAQVTESQLKAMIREEFRIPETLSSPDAESVLAAAFDDIVAEAFDSARNRLDREFETICEQEAPPLSQRTEEHHSACHLHGEQDVVETMRSASTVDD